MQATLPAITALQLLHDGARRHLVALNVLDRFVLCGIEGLADARDALDAETGSACPGTGACTIFRPSASAFDVERRLGVARRALEIVEGGQAAP